MTHNLYRKAPIRAAYTERELARQAQKRKEQRLNTLIEIVCIIAIALIIWVMIAMLGA